VEVDPAAEEADPAEEEGKFVQCYSVFVFMLS